jgi:hypothetical protein
VRTMRLLGRTGACLVMALLLAVGDASAETVYVQGRTAKLRAGKTSLDKEVADLRFGDELTVVKRDGQWLQVKTAGGQTGWIFANKVSATKPKGGDDTLAALGKNMRQREASDVSASAGARGLDKASEDYANRSGIKPEDRAAIDRMTGYQVPESEVEAFLKEGKLGEYGN